MPASPSPVNAGADDAPAVDPHMRKRAAQVLDLLHGEYPETPCPLDHRNAYQLLVATILSAQCTDERVNLVTPALFARYPGPAQLAAADPEELQELIRTTGFFRNKSRSLIGCAAAIVGEFQGQVPPTIEQLVRLPGVGRKTANVMLAHHFGAPAIVVDTHFRRVSQRLGFTTESDPDRIEHQMRALVPAADQTTFSGALNYHGRRCCAARKPQCPRCVVAALCPYPDKRETLDG